MGEESAGPPAPEVAAPAATGKAAGLTLSTRMWESRRGTAKFYSAAWTSSSIKTVASRLLQRAGPQLLEAAPAGSRSHLSLGAAIRGGSRRPCAQPACGRKTKEKGHVRPPPGRAATERRVTWRLFSLSARALLGAVVPQRAEEAAAAGRSGRGRAAPERRATPAPHRPAPPSG